MVGDGKVGRGRREGDVRRVKGSKGGGRERGRREGRREEEEREREIDHSSLPPSLRYCVEDILRHMPHREMKTHIEQLLTKIMLPLCIQLGLRCEYTIQWNI